MSDLQPLRLARSPEGWRVVRWAATSAAVEAMLVLLLIHSAYGLLNGRQVAAVTLLAFLVLLSLVRIIRSALEAATVQWSATTAAKMRGGLLEHALAAGWAALEHLGKDALTPAAQATEKFTDVFYALAQLVYGGAAWLILLVYLAWLAPLAAFAFGTLSLLLASTLALNTARDARSVQERDRLIAGYRRGIKAVVFNIESLSSDNKQAAATWRQGPRAQLDALASRALAPWRGPQLNRMSAQTGQLMVVAVMILLLSWLAHADAEALTVVLLGLLWFPFLATVQAFQLVLEREASAKRVAGVTDFLAAHHGPIAGDVKTREVRTLRWDGVIYRHKDMDDRNKFVLGPISLSLTGGRLLHVTGPDGSGKSTFLRLMAGFYPPAEGSVRIDDEAVDASEVARLCGGFIDPPVSGEDEPGQSGQASPLDETLDMNTRLENWASRRSAPILLLDEPERRLPPEALDRLIGRIIPELKERGHLVIIASQCPRYRDCADWTIALNYGKASG